MNSPIDVRQYAPATQRNRDPILAILLRVLPEKGNILEVSSGTGEHAAFFAPHFVHCQWIPSDPDPFLRASIQAWRDYNSVENMQPPFDIDARKPVWSIEELGIRIAATVNINMIHIAPWSACLGLMAGAGRILASRGILYIYGPFKQGGEHTAQSNLAFDRSLREQNSEWGVRNLEDVLTAAFEQGFSLLETVPMPANNFSVIFQRQ